MQVVCTVSISFGKHGFHRLPFAMRLAPEFFTGNHIFYEFLRESFDLKEKREPTIAVT